MQHASLSRRQERGFSLIEALIALTVMVLLLVGATVLPARTCRESSIAWLCVWASAAAIRSSTICPDASLAEYPNRFSAP